MATLTLNVAFYKGLGFNTTKAAAVDWLNDHDEAREFLESNTRNFTDTVARFFRKRFAKDINSFNSQHKLDQKEAKKQRDSENSEKKLAEAAALVKKQMSDMEAKIRAEMEEKYSKMFNVQKMDPNKRNKMEDRFSDLMEQRVMLEHDIARMQTTLETVEHELEELKMKGISGVSADSDLASTTTHRPKVADNSSDDSGSDSDAPVPPKRKSKPEKKSRRPPPSESEASDSDSEYEVTSRRSRRSAKSKGRHHH